MKKFVLLFVILAAVACQQREEPRSGGQFPAGSIRSQEEVRLLQDIVRQDPGNVNAWIQLGNLLMDTSRFGEAVDAYQKALAIDPKNVDVRVDIGTCYRNSGKPELAAQEYRKALELNPNHLNGRKNLAIVLAYDLRDSQQAIKEFEMYLKTAPNAPDAENVKREIERLKTATPFR